jgi:2-methylcitrate dehydratase PrpD
MAACLGIAANMGAGLREWATAGTTDIYFQNGFAARNGYLAGVLAEHGATGPATVFDGPAGLAAAVAGGAVDWATVLHAGEVPAAVRVVQFKRFPACSAVQTVLAVASTLAGRVAFEASSIERVEVCTHAHGKYNPGCDSYGPWHNVGQAQMSNQLGVALALLRRPMTVAGYSAGMGDEVVTGLAAKVVVLEDEQLSAAYPARSGASVRVFMSGGSVFEESCAVADPMSDDEIRDMFASVMSTVLEDEAGESSRSWEALRDPDPGRSVHEWTSLLRRAAPSSTAGE